jgi:hypothetical protein
MPEERIISTDFKAIVLTADEAAEWRQLVAKSPGEFSDELKALYFRIQGRHKAVGNPTPRPAEP